MAKNNSDKSLEITIKCFKRPVTKTGETDKRYKTAQFCKDDGTRDMRTKLTMRRVKTTVTKKTSDSSRKTTNLVMPTNIDGSIDKRYKTPQFCNNSGKKDKRTTATRKK